jgi:spoIIIJ-associated protein
MRITLDVGGYRTRREKTLRELARGVAKKVLDTRRPYHFEPMSAMERRVVHMTMSEMGLKTESEGEGRNRHVVVFVDDDSSSSAPPR